MPHTTQTLTTAGGTQLFSQTWQPKQAAKAQVLLVHGYAEHSGRYAHLAAFLNARGIGMYTYDQQGHGQSDGVKSFVPGVDALLDDLDQVLAGVKAEIGTTPLFIYGHSMGGAVVALHAIERHTAVKGVILSAPAAKISEDVSPLLIRLAPIMSALAPKLKTVPLDGTAISRDPAEVKKYNEDPLNYRGKTYARTGGALIALTQRIQADMEALRQPLLIMHGTGDRLTDPEGSKQLHQRAASTDKTLKLYEGLFHEIHNEPEKETVMTEVAHWIESRI